MGSYDYVEYETVCDNCRTKAGDFQTKDGERKLRKLNPLEVNNFYTHCKKCCCWIEFTKIKDNLYEKIISIKNQIRFKKEVKIK